MKYLSVFLTLLLAAGWYMQLSGLDILPLAKAPRKKLIECSWSSPDTAYLRAHIREMEAAAPYDGIRIKVNAVGKGKDGKNIVCNESTAFVKTRWEYEWFKPALEDMKNIKFSK